jgi:hypothetical protein
MFVFIVMAILSIAVVKAIGFKHLDEDQNYWLAAVYALLAVVMGVGAWIIYATADNYGQTWFEHRTFSVEAWMIAGVGIFWLLQTVDRWNDGAPPRTNAELAAS